MRSPMACCFFLTIIISYFIITYLFSLQPDGCDLSKFFISFNLILVVGASAISILPSVQEHQPRSGLLQSAVVSLYVMYLTWSALSNSAGECNASISGTNKVWYEYIILGFKDKICQLVLVILKYWDLLLFSVIQEVVLNVIVRNP